MVIALVQTIATARQFRALVAADVDIAQIGLQLGFVDRRTHIHRLVKPVADLQFFGSRDVAIDKLAVHALLHDDAAGRCTTLSRRTERAPQCAFQSQFQVGVVEDNHRILAA